METTQELINKKYVCSICQKTLSSKRSLTLHEYNICKFENKCNKCSKIFTSKNFLNRHQTLCIGNFTCKCGKILSRKQTFENHLLICKNK
jgi:hypothetical protein